jgi:CBS-domain-containing membrane protein
VASDNDRPYIRAGLVPRLPSHWTGRTPGGPAAGTVPVVGERMGVRPTRLPWDTRPAVAWTLFMDRGLTAATIIDGHGRPVGTLYRGDLAAAMLDDEPTQPGELPSRRPEPADWVRPAPAGAQALVCDLMRPGVSSVMASATLPQAREQLSATGAAELVVVDARGVMLGTIGARDVGE